jgi:Methyltransferase domain
MLFALLPAGDENTASSRIRVYTLARALGHLGVPVTITPAANADVVFVQKRVTPELVSAARAARKRGAIVIYDADDTGSALEYWAPGPLLADVLDTAHVVSTDTEGHREQLAAINGRLPVRLIRDAVDYGPASPVRRRPEPASPLRVLWFGSIGNFPLFERYTAALTALPDVEVVVATNAESVAHHSAFHPRVTFVPWSREAFIATLQSCHVTCLMHDGTVEDRAKSNNRMITSITWGVPAVVSATPEYERTARELGIDEAVFTGPDDVGRAVERLRSAEARTEYLAIAQGPVWLQYSPAAAARQFLAVAAEQVVALLGAATARPAPAVVPRPVAAPASSPAAPTPAPRRVAVEPGAIAAAAVLVPSHPGSGPAPRRERDYVRDWVSPAGQAYRLGVYERQRVGGTKPLVANPTIEEVRAALRRHGARSVLEVGCGWGRLMEELSGEFDIEGCDVSADMIARCSKGLRVFVHDIAVENLPFGRAHTRRWDVSFTRGVMLYFMEAPVQMAYAINNMLMLTARKIVVWEWPEVCARMREFSGSSMLEYHPIEHRSE